LLYFIAFECVLRCQGAHKHLKFLRYAQNLLRGYICAGGGEEVIEKVTSRRYASVFSFLMTPLMAEGYRRALQRLLKMVKKISRVSGC
ncbi:MAG: hypothetical protein DRO12_01570, partial [Thermoprotei archaeon]